MPPSSVFGTGKESREFVQARDVAQAVECVAQSASALPAVFNVASGVETHIDELVGTLPEVVGCTREVVYSNETLPGYPANWRADVSRLVAMGYRPPVTPREGLHQYFEWLRASPDTPKA